MRDAVSTGVCGGIVFIGFYRRVAFTVIFEAARIDGYLLSNIWCVSFS